ncbi:MAG: PP2C family protein-serine/threonine phosphatase [Angustibacter sp.]
MEVHSEVLARRRLSTRLQRYFRAHPSAVWARAVQPTTAALTCIGVLLTALAMNAWPSVVPFSGFIPFAVLAGLLLRPRTLAVVDTVVLACSIWVAVDRTDNPWVYLNAVIVLVVVMLIMFTVATSRARLGVQGTLGETMLVDLRDRLRTQGELPDLPREWGAEQCVLSAYGDSFSGDFLVANRSTDGRRLEVALVDVSGKGAAAGTRALMLSGAFGGLLGAMAPHDFLHAANQYLLRQRWDEGFATAVHLDLDFTTGRYRIAGAGHPPAAHFQAGSGRWTLTSGGDGPLLGVMDGVNYPGVVGTLARGDALLLYTDGVVETPGRDLDVGIDRMLGQAERLVKDGFRGGARRIVEGARAGETDDRALVLIWRA